MSAPRGHVHDGPGQLVPDVSMARLERLEFEQAVDYVAVAIQDASCLESEGVCTCTGADGELTLGYDDWFRLRGLLLCARFGACEEKWPPWFDKRALRHWQAWKAQGGLTPSEARRRFSKAVAELPGFACRPSSPVGCWTIVLPLLPCLQLPTRGLSLFDGLLTVRCEAPPRTPTLEEAEASRRKALAARPAPRGPPGTLESFCGHWRHVRTEGMEEYLIAFGVGLLRRRAAMAFTPSPAYHVERSRLCVAMPTPLGTRIEWLHPYGPAERDRDPQGHLFSKTVSWNEHRLISTFK